MGRAVFATGRMLIIFGPLLVFGTLVALLAFLVSTTGWHPESLRFIAIVIGGVVMVAATLLFYLQTKLRRSSDQALADARIRVGDILESAMDAIITIDETHRIIIFNTAAEKMFRWPRAAVIGQSLDMLIPERLRGVHREHLERFAATGVTSRRMGSNTVLLGLRADGTEFPIEASISQHHESGKRLFTVILRDVTERSRAEQSLARSEERLRNILESAMDAIITVDGSEHIVLFNVAAEAVFGCPREQALGAPLAWFIPERSRAAHSEHLKRFGEQGTTSRRMSAQRTVTGLRRSGEEFPVEASISQSSEHGSKFFTVILRDITARISAETALRQSREELRELAAAANSVREMERSRIARELHDELGQALTALKMDLTWIKDNPAHEHLSKIETMQSILDDMAAATRRISSDLRPLMLDDLGLAPAAEWLIQNFAQRTGIHCEISITPELELMDPYATAIFRILQESLTNVARHAQASRVDVVLDKRGQEIVLTVRDNGRGFESDKPRKPNSFGLLGLRERARMLDGDVKIDAAPGKGTMIEIYIPLEQI